MLGINTEDSDLAGKSYILTNQMNFLLVVTMALLSVGLSIYRNTYDIPFTLGDLRVYLLMGASLLNLALAYFGKHDISKLSLIYLSPVILLIYPTLTGFVEAESFYYYPLTMIGFSIVPQLLLRYSEKPLLYVFSILYYFFLLLLLDYLLILYAPAELNDVRENYTRIHIVNMIVSFMVFFFIQWAIVYLKRINYRAEHELLELNNKLYDKNHILDTQNEELLAINDNLKKTQQQLVYSEKMASLGVLTAGIAHEINNPLNFISGGSFIVSDFLNDLKNGHKFDEEMMAYAEQGSDMIAKGIDQAASVVSSLMTFSYSGKPKKKEEDINKIIESTLMFQKHRIPVWLKVEKSYNLSGPVNIYSEKMHQVILNLIDNALFEIKDSGLQDEHKFLRIETGVYESRSSAFISIANSGKNIDEETASKIFDPFFTTKEPGQGTGLGLSIVYNLIREHDGTIMFRNIDNGVEFVITIPLETE